MATSSLQGSSIDLKINLFLTSLLLKFYLLLFIGVFSKFPHTQSLHPYVEEDETFFQQLIEPLEDYKDRSYTSWTVPYNISLTPV